MTRGLVVAIGIALAVACGAPQRPTTDHDPEVGNATAGSAHPVRDTRTPLEQRRDAACKQLAPKLTSCAVEDAKADLAAGRVKQQQFEQDTAPGILEKNTQKFVDECTSKRDYSSRQIRVLEVCFQQETECGPLRACLTNLQPQK
jgi:hypothetical protein